MSTPDRFIRQIVSRSPEETRIIGAAIGHCLRPGDVLLLEGPFGAGKTCLAQGIATGLGVQDYVKSPSFTLVNEYRAAGGFPLYHIDLYRIGDPAEVNSFGLDEYLEGEGICVIEWSERAEGMMPAGRLRIRFAVNPGDIRILHIDALGDRYQQLVENCECF